MDSCIFQIIWIFLIHLWLSTLITSKSDDCDPRIMVPRNTMWKVCTTNSLEINCTINSEFQCWENISANWCRINDKACNPVNLFTKTKWKSINNNTRMMFLQFKNISMQDAGLYRCEIKLPAPSVSHGIKVSVIDNVSDCSSASDTATQEYNTTSENLNPKAETSVWLQSYMYICSGVAVLIIIVVSVIIIWCRGQKKRKTTIKENQSSANPVADHPPLIYPRRSSCKSQTLSAQISSLLPGTNDTPPLGVPSLKDWSTERKCPFNQRQCHDQDTVEKNGRKEENNLLIYASLNHNTVPQRPTRVTHVQMEGSEYATVRVT